MGLNRTVILIAVLQICIAPPHLRAASTKKNVEKGSPATASPSYERPQPATENLDLNMYQRIRDEGLNDSHVMELASALMDGIGPRLTGSSNVKHASEWARDQLAKMGCSNAHLEDWGEFGMGWQQLNTWVRMASPDTAVFIAQAVPWSPSTNGAVFGQALWTDIKEEKDLNNYKGKLAGKIVLLGEMRSVSPVDGRLFERMEDKELARTFEFPLLPDHEFEQFKQEVMKRIDLQRKIVKFFVDEHVLAVIQPSRDARNSGGSGGTIFVDRGMGFEPYKRENALPFPMVTMAIEHYGRIYRLLKNNVPINIEMNVDVKFTGDHEHGFDTVAEIPGSDPKLKDELVMLGAHLDSWASGTGATDNGAGTAVSMEVMRILNALQVRPRRTIRIALWTGEEQGEYGSEGYVRKHFGHVPKSTAPEELRKPAWMREPAGPVELEPDQKKISGYFNVDNGSGKILGVYLEENAAIAPIFEQWIGPLKDLGVSTITLRHTGGTDHEAFDAVGIPGFQFIQDPLEYDSRTHHSNMDTYERLQPGDLAQAATVEAIFVYNAAMRDQMLPRKPLPHPELEVQRKEPLKYLMPGAEEPAKDNESRHD
jgi:Peptidase family M28